MLELRKIFIPMNTCIFFSSRWCWRLWTWTWAPPTEATGDTAKGVIGSSQDIHPERSPEWQVQGETAVRKTWPRDWPIGAGCGEDHYWNTGGARSCLNVSAKKKQKEDQGRRYMYIYVSLVWLHCVSLVWLALIFVFYFSCVWDVPTRSSTNRVPPGIWKEGTSGHVAENDGRGGCAPRAIESPYKIHDQHCYNR